MDQEQLALGCLEQARWSARLGSPFYEALLQRMAADIRAAGPCWTALAPHTGGLQTPMAMPLLLLAAVHRHVLEGRHPEAGRYYPSLGGHPDADALWPHFLDAVPHVAVPATVQTNEVTRSCALLPGFLEVARQTALPLRLLEIGCSAGLNLRWDHYRYESAAGAWGDPASPVVFRDAFTGNIRLDTPVRVIERRGCDLNPIDPTLDESRLALLSFVWADQSARFGQLSAALEVARLVPVDFIDRADAVAWLETQLAEPSPGAATVVFHSVVLPYLSEDGRRALGRILSDAGARATTAAPLAWLSMEPGKVQAEVQLTVWPGGERRLIAESTFHGRDVNVL